MQRSLKHPFVLNLQRFAEPVAVDPDEPIDNVPPLPPVTGTPSQVAPEAWKNVEELLVTLSGNIRVQMDGLRERIERLEQTTQETQGAVQSGVADLQSTMAEFRQLLADATIEVPEEEVKQNEEQKEEQHQKSSGGWLARR